MQGAVVGESQARFIDEKPQACYHGSQCKNVQYQWTCGW